MNTIPKLLECLDKENPQISLPDSTIEKARVPIEQIWNGADLLRWVYNQVQSIKLII